MDRAWRSGMKGYLTGVRIRAAIGLIAAYAIALQTVFTALAPLPAHAHAADLAGLHILCFGGGSAAASDTDDPSAPKQASRAFHCVLCGAAAASAAILPDAASAFAPHDVVSITLFPPVPDFATERDAVRAGPARAPPLTDA